MSHHSSVHSVGGMSIMVPRFRGETVGQEAVSKLLSAHSYESHPDLLSIPRDDVIGSGSPPSIVSTEVVRNQRSQSVPVNNTSPTSATGAAAAVAVIPPAGEMDNDALAVGALVNPLTAGLLGGRVDDGTSSGAPIDMNDIGLPLAMAPPLQPLRISVSLPVTAGSAPPSSGNGSGNNSNNTNRISGGAGVGAGSTTMINTIIGSNGSAGSQTDRRSIAGSRHSSIDLKLDIHDSPASSSPIINNDAGTSIAMTAVGTSATPTTVTAVSTQTPTQSSTSATTTSTQSSTTSTIEPTTTAANGVMIPVHSRVSSRSSSLSIEFNKVAVARPTPMLSPLGAQIKSIKNGYAPAGFRCTVYLPLMLSGATLDGEPDFVQIEVPHSCVARVLIREALAVYGRTPARSSGRAPPESKLWDANLYRLYAAEDDGTIDTDFPALDDTCNVDTTGVDAFALQIKGTRSSSSSGDESSSALANGRGASSSTAGLTSPKPPAQTSPKAMRRDSESGDEATLVRSSSLSTSEQRSSKPSCWKRLCCCWKTKSPYDEPISQSSISSRSVSERSSSTPSGVSSQPSSSRLQ